MTKRANNQSSKKGPRTISLDELYEDENLENADGTRHLQVSDVMRAQAKFEHELELCGWNGGI